MIKKEKTVTVYMCGVDWNWEIGKAFDGNTVYPSIEALKENHRSHFCGIVECEINLKKWVEPFDWENMVKEAKKDIKNEKD